MSQNNNTVSHIGRIESIDGENIHVLITSVSACAHCTSKTACSMSEKTEKKITIQTLNASEYTVGEEVYVILQQSMGIQAIWWAYLLPFLILIITLLIGNTLLDEEGPVALISFVSLAIYYLVLYYFRKILAKKFTFTIAKIEK
ncbi:MAG: SoxR reducing system RseC family protein [Bacteroidales bacterium]